MQENRLLYFENEGDIEADSIVLKKSMMKRYFFSYNFVFNYFSIIKCLLVFITWVMP